MTRLLLTAFLAASLDRYDSRTRRATIDQQESAHSNRDIRDVSPWLRPIRLVRCGMEVALPTCSAEQARFLGTQSIPHRPGAIEVK
jgi:hypothetical protein